MIGAALQSLAAHASGPLVLLAAGALGLAVIWGADLLTGRGPGARVAARAMEAAGLAGSVEGSDVAQAERILATTRRRDLRARLRRWLGEVSASVGGRAGMRIVIGATVTGALAGALAAGALLGAGPAIAAAAGAGVGVALFRVVAGELRRRWSIAFLDQMVDAVELISRSVRSGMTTGAALRLVAREVGAPTGPVFARIGAEEELGMDMKDSLRRAAVAVNLPDFSFLAVALAMQRESGGQLSETLGTLHTTLRKRREARLKIAALTSEARASAMIVGVLPFVAGFGVYMVNRDQFMLLIETETGRSMLGVGAGLLAAGAVIMHQMVKARA